MAMPEQDNAYLMDLTALLKAFRETRQEAAQVVQQLLKSLQACRDVDTRTAEAIAQAVQRATTVLQQAHERALQQVYAEAQRQQATLTQQWQQVVERAASVQRWLPWKVALLLLGGTLLVNAGGAAWWWWHLTAERQDLLRSTALAADLDRYLRNTLYSQLPAARKNEIDTLYRALRMPSPGQHVP